MFAFNHPCQLAHDAVDCIEERGVWSAHFIGEKLENGQYSPSALTGNAKPAADASFADWHGATGFVTTAAKSDSQTLLLA